MNDSTSFAHDAGEQHAIVVTGMHRSGTSALSRALTCLGYAQPTDLMLAQTDNALGFWESKAVVALNDEILAALNLRWDYPALPLVETCDLQQSRDIIVAFIDQRFAQRAADIIKAVYSDERQIIVKDPRISLLVEFWDKVLRGLGFRTSYVHVFRSPLEVGQSLAKRNGTGPWQGHALWTWYNVSALSSGPSKRLLHFEELLADPIAAVETLARDLHCHHTVIPPGERIFLKRFVSLSHKHHSNAEPIEQWGALVSDLVKRVYAALTAGEVDGERLAATMSALRPELEEHLLFSGSAVYIDAVRHVDDPDVHLLADGERLEPRRVDETYVFDVPQAPEVMYLASRAGRLVGPDMRRLGLAVTRLDVDGHDLLAEPERLVGMEGWHDHEPGLRWTDGRARLPAAAGQVKATVAGYATLIVVD